MGDEGGGWEMREVDGREGGGWERGRWMGDTRGR